MSKYASTERTKILFTMARSILKNINLPYYRRAVIVGSIETLTGNRPEGDLDGFLERFIAEQNQKAKSRFAQKVISTRPLALSKEMVRAQQKANAAQPALVSCTSKINYYEGFIDGDA